MNLMKQLPGVLIPWHQANKRDLPWRTDPSPYHTWLSEIMLQQTRIEAVIPYYHRFLAELPTIADLADVSEERLLKLWEGLGYYSRARNLKKAAMAVMEQYGGNLPISFAELRALPGIGDYTAGAIASMAFGQPEPAVDGNVLRVVTRLTGDDGDIAMNATKKRITQLLREVYPVGSDAGDFTEGLMELGETICIPAGAPRCEECPARHLCVAYAQNLTQQLPVKSAKKERKIENKTLLLLHCNGMYGIRKRSDAGLLAGMWEFPWVAEPMTDKLKEKIAKTYYLDEAGVIPIGSATHIFTHIEWHMDGYVGTCTKPSENLIWVTPDQLIHEIALPTAFRYYKKWILDYKENM